MEYHYTYKFPVKEHKIPMYYPNTCLIGVLNKVYLRNFVMSKLYKYT